MKRGAAGSARLSFTTTFDGAAFVSGAGAGSPFVLRVRFLSLQR